MTWKRLVVIVILAIYAVCWLIGGIIAVVFNPIFWIVYLLLNSNCGCDRR